MAIPSPSLTTTSLPDGSTKIKLVAPYHAALVAACKRFGGKWQEATQAWYFDPRDRDAVAAACENALGINPLSTEPVERVTVELTIQPSFRYTAPDWQRNERGEAATSLPKVEVEWQSTLTLGERLLAFGQTVAYRAGRDTPVRLGPNVILKAGTFRNRGGSAKNPEIGQFSGPLVFEVRDIPVGLTRDVQFTPDLSKCASWRILPEDNTEASALADVERILLQVANLPGPARSVLLRRLTATYGQVPS